jgi:FKBP-type peptidyl-prolyl cis-trans isomerase FklB
MAVVLAALGCRQPEQGVGGAGKGATAAAPAPTIQSRKDKLSYAFGVDMARTIQRQKESLNVELLRRALLDTLAGEKLVMTDQEVASTLQTFEAEVKKDLEHARTMVGVKNRKASETFFADNARKEGVVTLPTGLQYKVLRAGSGKVPTLEDLVVCNYRGALLDGTEIDSSYKKKEPASLAVKSVIPGLAQALQLMPAGSKWQVFVPPQLAYGERTTRGFGPNSTLVFEVELLSIKGRAAVATR